MYEERIKRVLAAMEQMGLEQMLVSDPDSIWYLTGYDVFPFERLYAFYLRKDWVYTVSLYNDRRPNKLSLCCMALPCPP